MIKVWIRLPLMSAHQFFELLALWSPIAYDLRSLLVADRVGAILERIGDYSKNIARRSQVIVSEKF